MNKAEILAWIERRGSRRNVEGMARYGIRSRARVYGVTVTALRALAKRLGKNHELSAALWTSDCYEARMLAAFVEEPGRVTRRQMNAWAAEFDNWAICDTICFHLFDRTAFAWEKACQWATSCREFTKRAAFALMASLAVHDKSATDSMFLAVLPLIEEGARDERGLVKKAVSWSLRTIGKRSHALNAAAVKVAQRLARSEEAPARWVGKDALRDLRSPKARSWLSRHTKEK
jgi:3-methyladenine DNA glycosylase AlkD